MARNDFGSCLVLMAFHPRPRCSLRCRLCVGRNQPNGPTCRTTPPTPSNREPASPRSRVPALPVSRLRASSSRSWCGFLSLLVLEAQHVFPGYPPCGESSLRFPPNGFQGIPGGVELPPDEFLDGWRGALDLVEIDPGPRRLAVE